MEFVTAILAGFLLISTLAFAYVWDRQKTRYIKYQTIIDTFVQKATQDRNEFARIPAEVLTHMFELETRTVKPFNAKPGKQHRHPALRRVK